MALLNITNSFVAGTLAKSSEVNANFTDIVNWSTGQIQDDNLGVFAGPIEWSILTGVLALDITNSGSEGSIDITQTVALSASKASLKITHTVDEDLGLGAIYVNMAHSSSSIPALRLDYNGTTNLSVLRDSIRLVSRTTAQRNAISSPVAGEVLYNSTKAELNLHNGTSWTPVGAPSGGMLPYAGSSTPSGWLLCDGTAVSRTTYADLFTAIGVTWGVGDGSTTFNLPDARGRMPIGAGTGSGLSARTLGQTGGVESKTLAISEMPAHNHNTNASAGGYGLIRVPSPGNLVTIGPVAAAELDFSPTEPDIQSMPAAIPSEGGGASFSIMNPFFVPNWIIKI